MKHQKLVTLFERLTHWINAFCFVALILTGFEIHFGPQFPVVGSLGSAIILHNVFAKIMVINFALWLLYNLFTLRIRYFFPGKNDHPSAFIRQAKYYTGGIFKGQACPFTPSVQSKFNPFQKTAYLFAMFLLAPLQIVTGVYLMVAIARWEQFESHAMLLWSYIHIAGAFLCAVFLLAHLYMTTTGEGLKNNFRAMIFGYHFSSKQDDETES